MTFLQGSAPHESMIFVWTSMNYIIDSFTPKVILVRGECSPRLWILEHKNVGQPWITLRATGWPLIWYISFQIIIATRMLFLPESRLLWWMLSLYRRVWNNIKIPVPERINPSFPSLLGQPFGVIRCASCCAILILSVNVCTPVARCPYGRAGLGTSFWVGRNKSRTSYSGIDNESFSENHIWQTEHQNSLIVVEKYIFLWHFLQ